jgi:two-component system response regulator HupR/HoxA
LSERAPLPWDELLRLRAVARVREILDRRWGLGLGLADGPSGAQALQAAPGQHAAGDARPARIASRSGGHELALPVLTADEDGALLGVLVCGGLDRAGAGPGVDVAALSQADEELVGALLALAADEIARHVRERGLHLRPPGRAARGGRERYADIIGASPSMQTLYGLLDRVVPSDTTVLIQGENGTGKELVARAIHELSPRKKRRFVVTNCSAFNDNLLDTELFGHARGAFTGAVVDKQGLFEIADQGTFFLDEIGDMSPALQVKVLRVLQEGTFTRVGDTELRQVDVRIIAATNRDLDAMVASGAFREDLYYRVNVINLRIPPLRERPDDIEILVQHFLAKHRRGGRPVKELSRACLARLLAYPWPGNVRELENEIERLVVLAGAEALIPEELLSPRIRAPELAAGMMAAAAVPVAGRSLPRAVSELERRMIRESLERNDWNKTRASAELEISRRNLIRLVQKYGLEAEREL